MPSTTFKSCHHSPQLSCHLSWAETEASSKFVWQFFIRHQGSTAVSADSGGRCSPDAESDVWLLRQVCQDVQRSCWVCWLKLSLSSCYFFTFNTLDWFYVFCLYIFFPTLLWHFELNMSFLSFCSAFCRVENGPKLDHFFCLFFQQLIQPSCLRDGTSGTHTDISGTLFLDGLPAVRWLPLPPEIKVQVKMDQF